MTLRRRLVVTIVVAAVPIGAALLWIRSQIVQRTTVEMTRGLIDGSMAEGGREQCESDPVVFTDRGARWRFPPFALPGDGQRGEYGERERGERRPPPPADGPGPGSGPRGPRFRPRLYAYDATFIAAHPLAPPLDERVRNALRGGAEYATAQTDRGFVVVARMSWTEGPCAIIGTLAPTWFRVLPPSDQLVGWSALCLGLVFAVWLSAGPVVRRIHALEHDVRQSADAQYAELVRIEGSDEIAGLARAFNDAGAQVRRHILSIQEREETLRTFLANTTHDVMLPLTVLQGHIARLKDVAGDPALTAIATSAAEETEYIASLLQNLTAAAKLETGTFLVEHHDVDLSELVERVVHRHRRLASARHVELGHAVPSEPPIRIRGDVTLIEQAVGNFVQNAIRHNHEGGHVAVVLDVESADDFVLRIADDGPGVSTADLPRLGERRFRTEVARQRHPDGLGIGLSIARSVAERHGFRLTFLASDPSGLTVELRGARTAS
jgi:signal transduction histidine kinase